jgi:hypothetical protein
MKRAAFSFLKKRQNYGLIVPVRQSTATHSELRGADFIVVARQSPVELSQSE